MYHTQLVFVRYAHAPMGLVRQRKGSFQTFFLHHQRGAQQGEAVAKIKIKYLSKFVFVN